MVLLKLLFLSLIFDEFIADLDVITCPKGQMIKTQGTSQKCQTCPKEYHQPVENRSKQCKPCTKCDKGSGSEMTEKCTRERDTKCQCREGFVPVEPDFATCECPVGFGLRHGECSKCEDGTFNRCPNTACIKWKKCNSGVYVSGSSTSDVICNGESPTLNHTVSVITPPRETAQSHDVQLDTTTATTITAVYDVLSNNSDKLQPSKTTGYHIGMTFLILGIVALLVVSALACKVRLITCVRRRPAAKSTGDSQYRRPVEECGDGKCSNQNPKAP
nr:tumor necrosis factor receptor superfamily member 4-like [Nerophis lumbriciformis]